MLSKDQLQERLRREFLHERGGEAADASLRLLTKSTVVTGLELLSLHSNNSTCSSEQSDDDLSSFESFCANSITLTHQQQDAAAAPSNNKNKIQALTLIHKIVEEEQALEGVVADHDDSSSLEDDDFEDFCNDSFHRVDFNKGTAAANKNTTAIPNLETYAIAGGMGRAA